MEVRFETVDPLSADARSAVDAYFAELDRRFPTGFDPGHGGADADAANLAPPNGAFVVVRPIAGSATSLLGCGGVQRVDAATAEIKRMWIHDDARGRGLGRALLAHLESVAARLGHTKVVLDTNGALIEAITMYERAGYEPIDRYNDNPYAHHWFAKHLTD